MPKVRAPICWRCMRKMLRLYYRVRRGGALKLIPAGWHCPHCNLYRDLDEAMLVRRSELAVQQPA